MKLSKREVFLSFILGFVALIYLFNRFCLVPIDLEIEHLQEENQTWQSRIQADERLIQDHSEQESADIPGLKDNSAIDVAIPSSPGLPEILSFFDNKARENGVTIMDFRYSPRGIIAGQNDTVGQSAKVKFEELELSMSAKGSYPRLLNFILAIEESPRIFIIKHCKISGNRAPAAKESLESLLSAENLEESDLSQNNGEEEVIALLPHLTSQQNPMSPVDENMALSLSISAYFEQGAVLSLPEAKGGNIYSPPQQGRNPFFPLN